MQHEPRREVSWCADLAHDGGEGGVARGRIAAADWPRAGSRWEIASLKHGSDHYALLAHTGIEARLTPVAASVEWLRPRGRPLAF
jgi:hypothetical protein